MKKSRKRAKLAAYLTMGAMVFQFGQACTIFNSVATAGVASSGILIDDNGFFLGLINVCGTPNIQGAVNGVPFGMVQNGEDDLLVGCPVQLVENVGDIPDGGDGGDDGDMDP